MGRTAELAESVERLFANLDEEIGAFLATTGLACPKGCGACCLNPDIESTVLEFLPLARHLVASGQAEAWLQQLENASSPCAGFRPGPQPDEGSCGIYSHRGLICRLFAFSAVRNKAGALCLTACRVMKTRTPRQVANTQTRIDQGLYIPLMADYALRLGGLDPALGLDFHPINRAIQLALERALLDASFEEP